MLIEAIMNGWILQGEAALVVHDVIKKLLGNYSNHGNL
jgi:hypothetical protein